MRIFAGWIGKGDMVKESSHYVKDKASARRTTVAQEDKSWVGNGIDVLAKLAEVSAVNPIVGILLELCWTFGMRMQEAVMFRPVVAINEWGVWIIDGTKGGGRGRFVPIETELQIVVLGRALAHADGKTGFIGKRGITVKQKLQHFKDEMKKFGITLKDSKVTVHGLRHQFIHEMYKKLTGIEPPIRGGDISKLDKQTLHRAKQRLVELAGHTRTSINTAYSGSDRNPKSTQSKEVKSSESKADETSAPHKQEKE
jgi:integrase